MRRTGDPGVGSGERIASRGIWPPRGRLPTRNPLFGLASSNTNIPADSAGEGATGDAGAYSAA